MKLAIVVQRYGLAINGGAELHARYVAEHLARHAQVEVWTTCASDYVTWRNDLPPGEERINNIPVRRFPVKRERDPLVFGRISERVFNQAHSVGDELEWLDEEGPTSPALIAHIERHAREQDFCLFFSYRYYHAFHGARAAASTVKRRNSGLAVRNGSLTPPASSRSASSRNRSSASLPRFSTPTP